MILLVSDSLRSGLLYALSMRLGQFALFVFVSTTKGCSSLAPGWKNFEIKASWTEEKRISEIYRRIIIFCFCFILYSNKIFKYVIIQGLTPFCLSTSPGPCDAGYICFYNATRPTPTFELGVLEWGRLCSAGSFCPSGTTHEIECPEGRYR